MSKLDKALAAIDKKVDQSFGLTRGLFKRYFKVMSTVFLCFFMLLIIFRVFYTRPRLIASIVEEDVKLITLALQKIDAKCNILKVTEGNHQIDFLTVKAFRSSQVGPLNLAFPKKWEGPYLNVSPTIQEKHYEIVQAADGYFVVPGEGVQLPNGKIVGIDIRFTAQTLVTPMLKDEGALRYGDKLLAMPLRFKVGDWDSWHINEETMGDLNRMLREFYEAMPYTKNSAQQDAQERV